MTTRHRHFPLDNAPGLRLVESRPEIAADVVPYLEIVVPAFNEEFRLGPSLVEMAAYLAKAPYTGAITVVDNGSIDRTADLIVEGGDHPVKVRAIGCRRPGKGAAVRRGILTSKATYVGFSDADLSTPIETLDTIMPELEAGKPVVIASRKCPGAEYAVEQPFSRRMASRAFHHATRMCMSELGQIYDTQCGFKFFEGGIAERLFEQSTAAGFAFDVEILALAYMAGYDVTEVPTFWTHVEGSSVSVSGDSMKVLRELREMRRNLKTVAREGFSPERRRSAHLPTPPATDQVWHTAELASLESDLSRERTAQRALSANEITAAA